jgi:iron complex transport system substrate-binding protein
MTRNDTATRPVRTTGERMTATRCRLSVAAWLVVPAVALAACGGSSASSSTTSLTATSLTATSLTATSLTATSLTATSLAATSSAATSSTTSVGGWSTEAGNGTDADTAPVMPVTVTDGTGTSVTVTSVARVIPVDGDLAEIVFALGMGGSVVATDLSATYPPEADDLPQIGYQRALNAEPIAAFEPTLVLATDLAGPAEVLGQLRALDIPVVVVSPRHTIDGALDKVRQVAAALGVPERGDVLVATMQQQIAAATARGGAAPSHPRVAVLYVRGQQTQLIFGKGSGIDSVVAAAGAVDIGTELGIGDYGELTAEAMLQAEPDVILMSTTGLASVGGLAGLSQIPGLAETPAVRNGRVLTYEDQFLFGLGPRVGQFLDALVTALHPVAG